MRYLVQERRAQDRERALQAMHDLLVYLVCTGGDVLYACGESGDLDTVGELVRDEDGVVCGED